MMSYFDFEKIVKTECRDYYVRVLHMYSAGELTNDEVRKFAKHRWGFQNPQGLRVFFVFNEAKNIMEKMIRAYSRKLSPASAEKLISMHTSLNPEDCQISETIFCDSTRAKTNHLVVFNKKKDDKFEQYILCDTKLHKTVTVREVSRFKKQQKKLAAQTEPSYSMKNPSYLRERNNSKAAPDRVANMSRNLLIKDIKTEDLNDAIVSELVKTAYRGQFSTFIINILTGINDKTVNAYRVLDYLESKDSGLSLNIEKYICSKIRAVNA